MDQNGSKWIKMDQNGSKWIKTNKILTDLRHHLLGSAINRGADRQGHLGRRDGQDVERRPHVGGAERGSHPFQLDPVLYAEGRCSLNRVEDAVVGLNAIATQVERPIHGKEDVVVPIQQISMLKSLLANFFCYCFFFDLIHKFEIWRRQNLVQLAYDLGAMF